MYNHIIEVVRQKGDKVGNRIRISVTCLIALCLLAALVLAGTAAGEVSRNGLVAEWHFDGDAKDSSGNGNDGTIYGASFVEGKFGKALSFDGVDDYVEVPDSASLHIITNAVTVEVWIKIDKLSIWKSIAEKSVHLNWAYGFFIEEDGDLGFGIGTGGTPVGDAHVLTNVKDKLGKWLYIAGTAGNGIITIYVDGKLTKQTTYSGNINTNDIPFRIGSRDNRDYFNGIIDEVRIYNRALSADEIKAHYEQGQTALSITKSASPRSIKQGQTTTITLSIKNTGSTELKDIEVADAVKTSLIFVSGDTSKKFSSLKPQESRDFQYVLQSKDSGTFVLDPATATYADAKGNYYTAKSSTASIEVIPSLINAIPAQTPSPIITAVPTQTQPESSAVLLHGEKTDVVLGEDVLLKLSAVNLITKPPMTVQVMIYPPSGMSVTSSEFVKSGAGIYTTTYSLNPGDGKDIEVRIKTNQVGDFNVKGRIVYYFGDNKSSVEDHTLNLPITVKKEIAFAQNEGTPAQKTPGFGIIISISVVLFIFLKKRGIKE